MNENKDDIIAATVDERNYSEFIKENIDEKLELDTLQELKSTPVTSDSNLGDSTSAQKESDLSTNSSIICLETSSLPTAIEEIACCRVCHGESQPDNQLYYPCKCDGSIKYVHQQCLMEWLKVKKRQQQISQPRCELCGEIFVFQNVYAVGAPSRLTTYEIFMELIPRVLSISSTLLNAALAFFFWCIYLPVFTNCLIKVCWCVVTEDTEYLGGISQRECISASFPSLSSFDSFSFAWYSGIVNLCMIVAVTVVCFEVGQIIYREIEMAEKSRRIKNLERQLAEHVLALQKFEEDRRISESKMFAIADYESLNFQWKTVKKDNETAYLKQKLSGNMEVFADEIHVIQRYMIDKKFTALMAHKLSEVALLLPDFKSASEFYLNLNALLTAELGKLEAGGLFAASSTNMDLLGEEHAEGRTGKSDLQKAVEEAKDRAVIALEKLCQPADLEKFNNLLNAKKLAANMASTTALKEVDTLDNSKLSAEELEQVLKDKASQENIDSSIQPENTTASYILNAADDIQESEHVEYMGHLKVSEPLDAVDQDGRFDAARDCGALEVEEEVADSSSYGGDINEILQDVASVAASISSSHEDHEEAAGRYSSEKDMYGLDCFPARESLASNYTDMAVDGTAAGYCEEALFEFIANAALDNSEPEGELLHDAKCEYNEPATVIANEPHVEDRELPLQPAEELQNGPEIVNPNEFHIENLPDAPDAPVAAAGGNNANDVIAVNNVNAIAPAANNNNRRAEAGPPRLRVNFIGLGNEAGNIDLNYLYLIGCLMYIFVFLFLVIVVPVYLGRFIFNSYLLSDSVKQAIKDVLTKQLLDSDQSVTVMAKFLMYIERGDELVGDDKLVVADIMFVKTKAFLEIMIGYGVYFVVLLSLYFTYCLKSIAQFDYKFSVVGVITNQIKFVLTGVNTFAKLSLLLVLYGIVLHLLLVGLMFKTVYRSTPSRAQKEIDGDETTRGVFVLLLYFCSMALLAHVMAVCSELRQLIRKDYLLGFLPVTERVGDNEYPPYSLIGFYKRVVRMTYSELFKSFFINIILVLPGLLLTVIIPLRFGHFLCLSWRPVVFNFKHVVTDMQIPVEMIMSHIFIPYLVEKLQYRKLLRQSLAAILSTCCSYLALEWVLEPDSFPEIDFAALNDRNNALAQRQLEVAVPPAIPPVEPPVVPPVAPEGSNEEVLTTEAEGVAHPADQILNDLYEGKHNEGVDETVINDFFQSEERTMELSDSITHEFHSSSNQIQSHELDTLEIVAEETLLAGTEVSRASRAYPHTPASVSTVPSPAALAAPYTIRDLPIVFRIAILLILCFAAWGTLSSLALHLPLKFGRPLVKLLFDQQTENDVFSFPLGTAVCWLAGFVVRYIYNDIMGDFNAKRVLMIVLKWCGIVLKVAAVGLLWLLVPPMLLGYLIEALMVVPVRVSINETPTYPFWQSWAIGLIALKVWTRCVMTGMFGDIPLRLQLEHILIRGFVQFDASNALRKVFLPVTSFLLEMILVPFCCSRLLCMYVNSYLLRTVIVRFSIHGYIALTVLWKVARTSYAYIVSVHNEIRDSRYLIGTKLSNRT